MFEGNYEREIPSPRQEETERFALNADEMAARRLQPEADLEKIEKPLLDVDKKNKVNPEPVTPRMSPDEMAAFRIQNAKRDQEKVSQIRQDILSKFK